MLSCKSDGLIRHGIVLGMLCGLVTPACAADVAATPAAGQDGMQSADVPRGPERTFDFDIPAQPLAMALERFARITRLSIIVSSDMVRTLTSSPLRGTYPAESALRQLLQGSGLTAEAHDAGAAEKTYLLKEADRAAAPAGTSVAADQKAYSGLVQSRIWRALCADPRTVPGAYRLLFQFEVSAAGDLDAVRLLVSTGDERRDAGVLHALRQVQVGPPPPAFARQPVVMSLLPDSAGAALQCTQEGH